jgi:aminoglycoside phosphotransferase family enzyme
MDCLPERRALKEARARLDKSRLRETMAFEKAFHEIKHFLEARYDWGAVRKAQADVRLWESRCDLAEVALAECIENRKPLTQS